MTVPTQRLAGRRILITGAAAGIGRATARLFAAEGARVALLDRDAQGLAETAEAVDGFAAPCDVAKPAEVERAVAAAEEALGGLDGVVNAAGLLRIEKFEETALEDWNRVIDVNLNGTMLVCRSAIPALRRAGRGTIVNIASIGALKPAPASCAYSVAKAGVLMLGRCLANELGPDIRVNTVCPGTIQTAMMADMLKDNTHNARLTNSPALKRLGVPEDIAPVLLFLTSEESAFVNGATLTADGGTVFY